MHAISRWNRRSLRPTARTLALLTVSAIATLSVTNAHAQLDTRPCVKWTMPAGGKLVIRQGNGITVTFHLTDHRNRIAGTGSYAVPSTPTVPFVRWGRFGHEETGTVQGTLFDDGLEFVAQWNSGGRGYYSGDINRFGHIYGSTYRIGTPGSKAIWTTATPLVCAQRELAPPQPVPTATSDVLKPEYGSRAGRIFAGGGASTTDSRVSGGAAPIPSGSPATNALACRTGFVWRAARPADLVCVTPASRARVAEENRIASTRVQPGGGAYGPNTCRPGFVWREAFSGDLVCVTPDTRALVAEENRVATTRRALYSPRA